MARAFFITAWTLAGLTLLPTLAAAQATPPAKPTTELDDVPEKLEPKRPKTEADRDQIEAMSLFAAGRTEEDRDNLAAALRLYQRALRHDPKSLSILQQVIDVAQRLRRAPEVLRYGMMGLELDPFDASFAQNLGDIFVQAGEYENALKVYQRARALEKDRQKPAAYLELTMKIGRVSVVLDKVQEAADAFEEVMAAVDDKNTKLDSAARRKVLGNEQRSYLMFAGAFLADKRPALARAAFKQAHALAAPLAAVEAFHEAQVLALEKKPDEALAKLQEYLDAREASEGAPPYELLENVLKELGRGDEITTILDRALAADKDNAELRAYLAAEYLAAEKWKDAEPLLVELLKQSPKGDTYRGLLTVYRATKQSEPLLKTLADIVGKVNNLEPFEKEVQAIAENSELVTGIVEAARAAAKAGGADKKPDYATSLALGLLLLEAKRYDAAGEFLNAAIDARSDQKPAILLLWGLSLMTEEQNAASVRVFQRAVDEKVGPADNPGFLFYLGTALELDGKTDDALKAARAAAAMGKNPRIESRVAWIEYHAKRYSDAAKSYQQLLAKYGADYQNEEARKVLREARLTLSNIAVIQNNLPQAEEWLEQVLDEFPEDISALNDLGYLWADQGKNLVRALEMVRMAVAAEPDNIAYQDSLGWALYRLGRYEEALEALKKAAAGAEVDGVILEHLGDVQQARGQKDEARKAWQQAIEVLKKNKETDKIPRVEDKLKKQ